MFFHNAAYHLLQVDMNYCWMK